MSPVGNRIHIRFRCHIRLIIRRLIGATSELNLHETFDSFPGDESRQGECLASIASVTRLGSSQQPLQPSVSAHTAHTAHTSAQPHHLLQSHSLHNAVKVERC